MSAVCRACLVGDVKMYSLESHILDMYEKLTNTKLSARGPQAVCYICHSLLQRCHRFAEMARCSENTLQDLLDNGIEASHENTLELNPTIWSSLSTSSMQFMAFNIQNCLDFPHIKEEYDTSEKEFAVNEEFTEAEAVVTARDFPAVVSRPMEYLTESSLSESTETYQKIKLSAHIQTRKQVSFACDVCNQTFTRKCSLKKHILLNHKRESPNYVCDICDKQFSWKHNLTKHMVTHTANRPYRCDVCNKRFSKKSNLTVHMRTHTGERPYACDVCDKSFSQKMHLTGHMRNHTGKRLYACDVCDKSFSSKYRLTYHMRTHTGEKPYACNVCAKSFSQKYYLTEHMRTHTRERPYACNVCDKRFSHKSTLTNHMRNDVMAVHRVPHAQPHSNKQKNIILKLASRTLRDNILSASRLKKGQKTDQLSTDQLGLSGTPQTICLNEHLPTLRNKGLFRETREAAKKFNYKYVWVQHATILVRKSGNSPAQAIRSYKDIEKMAAPSTDGPAPAAFGSDSRPLSTQHASGGPERPSMFPLLANTTRPALDLPELAEF